MKKKSMRKLIFKILTIIFIVLLILAILALIYLISKIYITGDRIHKPLDRKHSELRNHNVNFKDKEPFTIALFGIDSDSQRTQESLGQRSDSIMILSINENKQKTQILSIPRDTKARIIGKRTEEKIAHAYAYGGPNMSVKSLENLMNVPIDHYATIDMDGLKEVINDLDGINVVSNDTFTVDGLKFRKGQKTHVNGTEAMKFIRSRKEEGAGGDFGRQKRQQLILEAMSEKLKNISSLKHFDSIMTTIQKNVKTDLTVSEMNTIKNNYKDANKDIEKKQLEGNGGIQNDGLYYFIPSQNSKEKNRDLIINNLKTN